MNLNLGTLQQSNIPFMAVENGADGLVAIGGDFSPDHLIKCYKNGIFPWFVERGVPFWFCPDPRLVLYPQDFKLSRSLKKSIKHFEITINQDFMGVIKACRGVRRKNQKGTWITKAYIQAYSALFHLDKAMSVEVWLDGELIGGLYGVFIEPVFYGESMFFYKPDASKAALAHLIAKSEEIGIKVIDCQQATHHLKSMGAKEISKDEFLDILKEVYA